MKADLHVHTKVSDSSFSIQDTINIAKLNGVTHLGIVDHDTTAGLEEAICIGNKSDVKIIPGIEISAYDFRKGKKVHILGYNFDLEAINIKKLCDPLLKRRHQNSLWQIRRLIEIGYSITKEDVIKKAEGSTAIYKQHIMDSLIQKGYTDSVNSDLYKRLFKNKGICRREIEYIDVFEAVKAIKADGGKAVLAHPGQLNSYYLIDQLVDCGMDGIELNHHDHTKYDLERIYKFREKFNLLLTGGSDYHGRYGLKTSIGSFVAPNHYVKYLLN